MCVYLPNFCARRVRVEVSRWTQDARFFIISTVEIHFTKKLVDHAALPFSFLSRFEA